MFWKLFSNFSSKNIPAENHRDAVYYCYQTDKSIRIWTKLYKTSYRHDCSVCSIIADLDSVLWVGCMDDLSVAHVNCNVSTVTDQISWLCICIGHLCTCILLLIGCSRKADAKVCIYTLYETGAVCSISKACTAPYIWVADKLCCIIYNRRTGTTAVRGRRALTFGRRCILWSI